MVCKTRMVASGRNGMEPPGAAGTMVPSIGPIAGGPPQTKMCIRDRHECDDQSDESGRMGKDGEEDCGDQDDRRHLNPGDVEVFAMFVNKSAGAIEHRGMESDAIGELRKSLVNEVCLLYTSRCV